MSPTDLSLDSLVANCRQEIEDYFEGRKKTDFIHCFELWRRALAQRNEAAWEAVYSLYLGQVKGWLRQFIKKWPSVEFEEDYLANQAYYRIYRAITPEKFANFPNVARLLEYLKLCCSSEVLSIVRYQTNLPLSLNKKIASTDDQEKPYTLGDQVRSEENLEKEATERIDQPALWQLVNNLLHSQEERAIIYARFRLGLPPRNIVQLYPALFKDEKEVYRLIRKVMERLKQDARLRKWFDELKD